MYLHVISFLKYWLIDYTFQFCITHFFLSFFINESFYSVLVNVNQPSWKHLSFNLQCLQNTINASPSLHFRCYINDWLCYLMVIPYQYSNYDPKKLQTFARPLARLGRSFEIGDILKEFEENTCAMNGNCRLPL